MELIKTVKLSKLQAIFDLRILGLGVIRECRLVRRIGDGKLIVHGPSVRAETGGYPKFVVFEPAAIERVTALAREQYDAVVRNG